MAAWSFLLLHHQAGQLATLAEEPSPALNLCVPKAAPTMYLPTGARRLKVTTYLTTERCEPGSDRHPRVFSLIQHDVRLRTRRRGAGRHLVDLSIDEQSGKLPRDDPWLAAG
jgi:hypothetical protein